LAGVDHVGPEQRPRVEVDLLFEPSMKMQPVITARLAVPFVAFAKSAVSFGA